MIVKNRISQLYSGLYALIVFAVCLTACTPVRQVITAKDSAPIHQVHPDAIADAIPRQDAITRAGNKNPYTVLGETYYLLASSHDYRQEGIASWYGTKFQGRPTANGEAYNLYAMTAAHRTLKIPTYVRVTNLENNRSTIVRVNDRGPFHSDRIIDLSYAAALKLGYAEKGTARVLVESIAPAVVEPPRLAPIASDRFYLQVGAFRDVERANSLQTELSRSMNQLVTVKASEPTGFYRVQLGPLSTMDQVEELSAKLLELNIEQPRLIIE